MAGQRDAYGNLAVFEPTGWPPHGHLRGDPNGPAYGRVRAPDYPRIWRVAAVASSKAFHYAERAELDAMVLSLNHVLDRKVRRAAETGLPSVRVRDLFLSNPQKNEFKAVPRLTNLRND